MIYIITFICLVIMWILVDDIKDILIEIREMMKKGWKIDINKNDIINSKPLNYEIDEDLDNDF